MASLAIRISPVVLLLVSACAAPPVDIHPLDLPVLAGQGDAFGQAYREGKRQLAADRAAVALIMFERALDRSPDSVAALNAVAVAYDRLHRPDLAAPYYRRALALAPDSADILNNMALSVLAAGDHDKAGQLLHQARAIAPDDPTITANLQRLERTVEASERPPPPQSAQNPAFERTGLSTYRLKVSSHDAIKG